MVQTKTKPLLQAPANRKANIPIPKPSDRIPSPLSNLQQQWETSAPAAPTRIMTPSPSQAAQLVQTPQAKTHHPAPRFLPRQTGKQHRVAPSARAIPTLVAAQHQAMRHAPMQQLLHRYVNSPHPTYPMVIQSYCPCGVGARLAH
jgi:hypothetical protein